jgi:hypothetical protein
VCPDDHLFESPHATGCVTAVRTFALEYEEPDMPTPDSGQPGQGRVQRIGFPLVVAGILSAATVSGCIYGKLKANLRSENFNIAQALVAGEGFAHAFGERTGPTAWCAPVYPCIQAALLWAGDGDPAVVVAGLVILQGCVLVGTSILVVALAWQTNRRSGAVAAAILFFLGLLYHAWFWFQMVHDCWLILLALDLLVAGFCWLGPLERWHRAVGWGLFGALCALTNPVVGFVWGIMSLVLGWRQRNWKPLALAVVFAGLGLAPWGIRNFLVFGRFIPMKSNLAYELFQSQCLQSDGLYQMTTARLHPSTAGSQERQLYKELREPAYMDRKWEQFRGSVWAEPLDFLDRIATRFLGATVWYVPFDRAREARQPWLLWARRLTHPLPFLALLILLFTSTLRPLTWTHWTVIGVYVAYLLPYIAASYYERYAVPLLATKVMLVIWAVYLVLGCFRQNTGRPGDGTPGDRRR